MASSAPFLPPRPPRRPAPRWLGPILLVALLGAAGATVGGVFWGGYELRREAARLARERDELRRQNAQLREEIRLLYRPEYIERLAREELALVRPGELAVILVEPMPAPAQKPMSAPPPAPAQKPDRVR